MILDKHSPSNANVCGFKRTLMVRLLCAFAATGFLTLPTAALAQFWIRSWAAAPVPANPPGGSDSIPSLANMTLRQVMRISAGGGRIVVRLSNELSSAPLEISDVHVALAGKDGAIVPGSDRTVTFSGATGTKVAAQALVQSDPVVMPVAPLARLVVSIHFAKDNPTATWHPTAFATAWIAPGDQTGAVTLANARRYDKRLVVTAIDVERRTPSSTVVTLGDSITDGAIADVDRDNRWPDLLAERLQRAGMRNVAVANAGIGANRVLTDYYGPSALARFDRDVLAVPGARHVIVLEGINDLGMTATRKDNDRTTAPALIAAYRQMIARAHARGVKVYFATILPYKGARDYWFAEDEVVRKAVNAWVRDSGEPDGVIDFDAALRDPADPERILSRFVSGDHLHPNAAGFAAMAAAVDLTLLRSK